MGWTNSKVFRIYVSDMIANATAYDWDADTVKAALYGTTPTPSADVTAGNSAYAVDQWVVGSEISSAGQWAVGGVALASKTNSVAASLTVTIGAANTASGATATLAAVFGCLVYDDTLTPKAGFCFNYFGGTNTVTSGTFTIIWNALGIMAYAL